MSVEDFVELHSLTKIFTAHSASNIQNMIADCLWNILLLKAPKNGYLNQNCNLLLYIYFSMLKVAQLPLNIQCFKLIPASTHTVRSTSLLEFRLTR